MSKQSTLLVIVLVSMHACLLHVDARRLRVAFLKSTLVRNYNGNDPLGHSSPTTASTVNPGNTVPPNPPKCAPESHQLKYYSGLYGSNSANVFNGNILYYALKAVEADKNRTSLSISAEDNAIIASINQSRFTPGNMDTANKVVCAKILQEMDQESNLFSKTALCGWDYICDYKEDRFPHYLFKAVCKSEKCNGNCKKDNNKHNICQSHGIYLSVLEKRECSNWVWTQKILPLACTCTSDVVMKAENGISK